MLSSPSDTKAPLPVFATEDLPEHWAKLTRLTLATAQHSDVLRERAAAQSEALFHQYLRHGCLPDLLLREALALDDSVITLFFNRLYRHAGLKGQRPPSPLKDVADTSWMSHTDYCFINARATGRLSSQTGNWLNAARLLPVIRARAIHLAPFFESVFGVVYAQDSFSLISEKVTHAQYEALGFSRYEQLRYFIDCCHLLGKAVGFDLTSHTSGFSKLSLDQPELFRWLRFAPDYLGLHEGATVDAQYEEPVQAAFTDHIRGITRAICDEHGLPALETTEFPASLVNAVHARVKSVVRSFGYYPVVPHTWNGIGLPGVASYNRQGGYPEWDYRDAEGKDQSAHGIGIHASMKFHTGLKANTSPWLDPAQRGKWRAELWRPTQQYLCELFPRMHRDYGFDFLRIDYVDHVFRGTIEHEGQEVVLTEQLSPAHLRAMADAARQVFPAAGMLADHVGNDIADYRRAGFSAILGKEVQYPLRKYEVLAMFGFNHELMERQRENPCYGTAVFPIDTHDMGHPALLGKDLAEREERATVLLRQFFSRFASAGTGQRPKYEVLGTQDLSKGIFRANNAEVSLEWSDDRAALAGYHLIEDTYESVREDWLAGHLAGNYVFDDFCWWQVACPSRKVSYVALSWFGERYDHDGALRHRIHSAIPVANVGAVVSVEVVLGLKPARDAQDTGSLRLDARHLEHHLGNDGQLHLHWPNGTGWLLRLRYR